MNELYSHVSIPFLQTNLLQTNLKYLQLLSFKIEKSAQHVRSDTKLTTSLTEIKKSLTKKYCFMIDLTLTNCKSLRKLNKTKYLFS